MAHTDYYMQSDKYQVSIIIIEVFMTDNSLYQWNVAAEVFEFSSVFDARGKEIGTYHKDRYNLI